MKRILALAAFLSLAGLPGIALAQSKDAAEAPAQKAAPAAAPGSQTKDGVATGALPKKKDAAAAQPGAASQRVGGSVATGCSC